jgi:hypothetical protein
MDSTPTDKSISTKFGGPSPEYGNLMVERRSPNPEGKKDGRSLLKNEQAPQLALTPRLSLVGHRAQSFQAGLTQGTIVKREMKSLPA